MKSRKARLPAYQHIATDLRKRMVKEYRPGDMLPSDTDLGVRYSVHPGTIRQALSILVRDGLICRYQGRGTVVVDRTAIGEFAIVMYPGLWRSEAFPYYGIASTSIAEILGAHNPHWDVKVHVGKINPNGGEHALTLDFLDPDVLKRIRGVFSFHRLGELEPRIQAAKVPLVFLGWAADVPSVALDYGSLYEQGLAHLKAVGCRSVGAFPCGNAPPDLPDFAAFAAAKELECHSEWLIRRTWPLASAGQIPATEQMGYDGFMRLWADTPRPDGFLVSDDVFCRGVLRAVLQLGIKMPGELRLVTHANRGVALPYHERVTRVEFDPTQQARLAVDIMIDLLRGKTPEPLCRRMPGVLMKGATT